MAEIQFNVMLRDWRKALDLTQKEAADKLGANLRTYQNWEVGRYDPPAHCVNCLTKKMADIQQASQAKP